MGIINDFPYFVKLIFKIHAFALTLFTIWGKIRVKVHRKGENYYEYLKKQTVILFLLALYYMHLLCVFYHSQDKNCSIVHFGHRPAWVLCLYADQKAAAQDHARGCCALALRAAGIRRIVRGF
jgi:hypothetical protein